MPRELKEGSKGYCRNCGFAIEVHRIDLADGRTFTPRWGLAWVHVSDSRWERHCMWTAEPKRHTTPPDRTLYEKAGDLRAKLATKELMVRRLGWALDRDDVSEVLDIVRELIADARNPH